MSRTAEGKLGAHPSERAAPARPPSTTRPATYGHPFTIFSILRLAAAGELTVRPRLAVHLASVYCCPLMAAQDALSECRDGLITTEPGSQTYELSTEGRELLGRGGA
ncbi:hypothetical protein [Deinococcus marmoris]|uniref:Transcriptional regulator n=1 Tax=Deinococcus marmoris TaxID=249408 RepID=A0A1U7P300_9DEIO|nr:hypothetical protein [Deinococcus marmoris]OLV19553.1 hypothetical protein BOO71_0002398 [Deinococcus marmoris]